MKQELIDTIHGAIIGEYWNLDNDSYLMAVVIQQKTEPLIELEAQKFAGWVANQVIGGRTYDVLWRDYQEVKRSYGQA